MDDMLPDWSNWFDTLATCMVLVGVLWAGLRELKLNAPPAVVIGLLVWLAAMAVAIFLIIGPDR